MRHMAHGLDPRNKAASLETMTRLLVLIALAAGLATAGYLAAGALARTATQSGATVSLRQTKLGPVLVSSKGRTLYLFAKDRNAKSACYGSCATFWPPLLAQGRPTAGPGLRASLLGTTRRSTGGLQVTYNKHPLYTFVRDKLAGQTTGEGNLAFGARWYAVSPKGLAVLKAPPATTTGGYTTTTGSGYTTTGYGYGGGG
jgi:predicted lipoprotein with Yx(FWY)xxD motif